MYPKSKKEYVTAIRIRYLMANKTDKKIILDEVCAVCGYNRKYAIRKLNFKAQPKDAPPL